MMRRFHLPSVLGLLALFAAGWTAAGGTGEGKDDPPKTEGTVSGIVIDKRGMSIIVKIDGQEKPVTYVADASDKKTLKTLAGIFSVARVRLTYKTNGETRQLVSIQKTGTKGMGTVTGVVLATHEWWVEIKPKKGPPEGYAATYPAEHWKATLAKLKELRKGDTVVINYYTDFERHRIKSIRKTGK